MARARYDVVLPHDLVVEILSWVPVNFLLRFRCVCKVWNSLIFHPTFVKLHLQRSHRDTPILFTLLNSNLIKHRQCSLRYCSMERLLNDPSITVDDGGLPFKLKYRHIIGVCNGLVCLSAMSTTCQIWVRFWNPATRLRSKKSPCTQGFRDVKMGFGYDDSSDTYKVVATVFNRKLNKMEILVYCLGDNCWRKVASSTDFPFMLRDKGQFVSGTINWLAKCNATDEYVIFSFDIKNETYKYLSLPDDVDVRFGEPEIGVSRGYLCLSRDHNRTHFAVWQMKEFGVHNSWTLVTKVSYEHLQISPFSGRLSMHANNKVRLVANKSEFELVLHNWRDTKVEHSEGLSKLVLLESINYVESLVLPYRI